MFAGIATRQVGGTTHLRTSVSLGLLLLIVGCGEKDKGAIKPPPAPQLTTARIAFVSNRTGTSGIHLYNPATGRIIGLSPAGVYEQDPAISPDGTRIAFVRHEADGRLHLMTMAVDGTDRKDCTNDATTNDTTPYWSPDGQRLVFTRTNRTSGVHDVYTVQADGSSLLRVTNDSVSTALAWSPDGSRLLFVHQVPYNGLELDDVTVINPDGSEPHSLFGPLAWTFVGADYSPDGTLIVLTYHRGVLSPRLDLANADGSNRKALVESTDLYEIGRPSWSPDGATIVFSGHAQFDTNDLFLILPDGSDPQPLLEGSPVDQTPNWGPKP